MKKYELSKIGGFHINHNEDSSAITEIGNDKILIAVMDGCSMGKESHFASTLIAKLLFCHKRLACDSPDLIKA